MSPNKYRHQILQDLLEILKQNDAPLDYAVHIGNLTGNDSEKIKALKYLLAGKFLKYVFYNQKHDSVLITQLGLDAFNGEYFLEKDSDDLQKKKNNTITAISAIVVAIGVVYSILAPTVANKQAIQIQLQKEGLSKPIADTIVIFDKRNDSATLIYKVGTETSR